MKRILSFTLAFVMLLCVFPAIPSAAAAPKDKDGYTLSPVMYGDDGVDAAGSYVLTTPEEQTLEEVQEALSIDGQPPLNITRRNGREFLAAPGEPLAHNRLYTFRLTREGKNDLTWVYQTSPAFEITGCFPGNEATNVPLNTGVELTFSTSGYSDLENFFTISPRVSGRFEVRGDTTAFVPSQKLAPETVYTVTVAAGIAQTKGSGIIAGDYVFSFETAAAKEPEEKPAKHSETMYFGTGYAELPGTEAPVVYLLARDYKEKTPLNPQIHVYKIPSTEQAIEAVQKRAGCPGWSRYAREKSKVDVSGLKAVVSFRANQSYDAENKLLTLPEALPEGFYVIEARTEHSHEQMILQISDLPIHVVADGDKAVVWVNDVTTGGAVSGARVQDENRYQYYTTGKDGTAVIDRGGEDENRYECLTVTAPDGRRGTWFYKPGYSWNDDNDYWKYLRMDRSLFQPDDTLYFWGFVQNRYEQEEISGVRAVLSGGYGGEALHTMNLDVEDGTYSGEIQLPDLPPGSYYLRIYHGELLLSSTYFSVETYVKPAYVLKAEPKKAAYFVDEDAEFEITSAFFEGTPVSSLDVSYSLSGYDIIRQEGETVTGSYGAATVSVPLKARQNAQGSGEASFHAEAVLPEIGSTVGSSYMRVFVNDIDVSTRAVREGKKGSLSVGVNSITLDRLNDGTAENYYDYLDGPVRGKELDVSIFRSWWAAEENGDYYDYIEKKVVPQYRYVRKTELLDSFTMTTGADGNAEKTFTVPDRCNESYYAEIKCTDGNGRKIERTVYLGRDYTDYYYTVSRNDYHLETEADKTSYSIGEAVSLTMKRGDRTLEKGNFLFIRARGGITEYGAGKNPYTFEFSADDVPNTGIYAWYFDGMKYHAARCTLYFEYTDNDLDISVIPDQEGYHPGDMCTLRITTRDRDGLPRPAEVNISVVDEALLALRNYSVDPLESLYGYVSPGVKFWYSTHNHYYPVRDDVDAEEDIAEAPEALAPGMDPGSGEDSYLRESFKDTAAFHTVTTDAGGTASFTFRLPDNITSWRIIAAGISTDLYAGSYTGNIIVTIEAFLNYTLSDTFLTGDMPVMGVNIYGTALQGAETVLFEVWDEKTPGSVYSGEGAAWERVNIPLWEMRSPGSGALIIRATVDGTVTDMVRHEYEVLETYREIETQNYHNVSTATVFEGGAGGFTEIVFTDKSTGQYLYQLRGLRCYYGDRLEKHVVNREVDMLMKEYFPEETWRRSRSFNPREYQKSDGGLAILPHGGSDLFTTVKLMPWLMGDVDTASLKSYLRDIYEGDGGENKICALYGLAMLKEPVLLDLDAYARLEEISIRDAVYLALGYEALGEIQTAAELYDTHIAPQLEHTDPYCRVNTGGDSEDILNLTSSAGLLAAKLDKPEQAGLYEYCRNHRSGNNDPMLRVETLGYLTQVMARTPRGGGSISYTLFGESHTRSFYNGSCFYIRIPSMNLAEFKLTEVIGTVGAVTSFMVPMEEESVMDTDISVRREYFGSSGFGAQTAFDQGELVEVVVTVNYSGSALRGSYSVTDTLPSGLAYVSNSAKSTGEGSGYSYARANGQQVSFYSYNRDSGEPSTYSYYARVVSPGTYRAEGVLVQNLTAPDYISVGGDDTVVIEYEE